MKNYVHLGGAEIDNSVQGLHNSSYHAQPHSIIVNSVTNRLSFSPLYVIKSDLMFPVFDH